VASRSEVGEGGRATFGLPRSAEWRSLGP
jgi:hypothetical protein